MIQSLFSDSAASVLTEFRYLFFFKHNTTVTVIATATATKLPITMPMMAPVLSESDQTTATKVDSGVVTNGEQPVFTVTLPRPVIMLVKFCPQKPSNGLEMLNVKDVIVFVVALVPYDTV